jgi:hypothetical protein
MFIIILKSRNYIRHQVRARLPSPSSPQSSSSSSSQSSPSSFIDLATIIGPNWKSIYPDTTNSYRYGYHHHHYYYYYYYHYYYHHHHHSRKFKRANSDFENLNNDDDEDNDDDDGIDTTVTPKPKISPFDCHDDDLSLPTVTLDILLVEVKGPSDHLAQKQIMWIKFLNNHGVKTCVGYVKET